MKIQYRGADAVDIPGHDDVQPGQVVEVTDAVGTSLLAAGTSYDPDGQVVAAPSDPLWSTPTKKSTTPIEPAVAPEKEG